MDVRERVVLLGSGGHARSVADSIMSGSKASILGTVAPSGEVGYCSIPWLGDDGVLPELRRQGVTAAHIAIGYLGKGDVRPRIRAELESLGYQLFTVVDTNAVLAQDCSLGNGVFVAKGAVINARARVGDVAIINTGSVIEHDCIVGDYSHVSVGAVLCGGVMIGRSVLVGASATILQGRSIGDGAIIGAGSLILHDVPPGEKVVGVF